jgi:hypothetical protein
MVELTIFHCRCRFGNVRIHASIFLDLDLYLVVDQRYMIDALHNFRVGYWGLRNNV